MSAAEYVRSLLPISNALRLAGGVEALDRALSRARCYKLRGGSTAGRMSALLELAGSLNVERVENPL